MGGFLGKQRAAPRNCAEHGPPIMKAQFTQIPLSAREPVLALYRRPPWIASAAFCRAGNLKSLSSPDVLGLVVLFSCCCANWV